MSSATGERTDQFAICAGCTCLCDDIEIKKDSTLRLPDCRIAREWFDQPSPGTHVFVDGRESSLEDAIKRAAHLLTDARAPLVCGLDGISNQAQASAWSVASELKATIDTSIHNRFRSGTLALQAVGKSTATLGEVSTRSKIAFFWFCDPQRTHPRLIQRYCQSAEQIVVIGPHGNQTGAIADQYIELDAVQADAAINVMRSLLAEKQFDEAEAVRASGHSIETWQDLVSQITGTQYAALFYGETHAAGEAESSGCDPVIESLYKFAIDVNQQSRFVVLGLRDDQNALSAENVLTAGCGFPFAVQLHPEPGFNGLEFSAEKTLGRDECDVVLICSTPGTGLEDIPGHIEPEGRIVLTHQPELWKDSAAVVISTGINGLDQPGDWIRLDGVLLPMEAIRDDGQATLDARRVLDRLMDALRESG